MPKKHVKKPGILNYHSAKDRPDPQHSIYFNNLRAKLKKLGIEL